MGETVGKNGRDGGVVEGKWEWLQQLPSVGLSAPFQSPLPLPMAFLNHFLKSKIKTQPRFSQRKEERKKQVSYT